MSERAEIEQHLTAVGTQPDSEIDIAATALALAALDRPRVRLDRYHAHLEELAAHTAEAAAGTGRVAECAAALTAVLHGRHGYRGDTLTYDDPQNANLIRVVDRRRGLPVALGILYMHAARAQGWNMRGLNFPGHFLLRLDVSGERIIVDPFNGGRVVETGELRELLKQMTQPAAELRPEHYRPVGNRDVLLRLQNNIKTRALQAREPERAVAVLQSMVAFAPGHAVSWRELGVLQMHLGNLQSASEALQACILQAGDERIRKEAEALLQQIRTRLH